MKDCLEYNVDILKVPEIIRNFVNKNYPESGTDSRLRSDFLVDLSYLLIREGFKELTEEFHLKTKKIGYC